MEMRKTILILAATLMLTSVGTIFGVNSTCYKEVDAECFGGINKTVEWVCKFKAAAVAMRTCAAAEGTGRQYCGNPSSHECRIVMKVSGVFAPAN